MDKRTYRCIVLQQIAWLIPRNNKVHFFVAVFKYLLPPITTLWIFLLLNSVYYYFGIVLLFSTLVIFKKISVKDDFAPSRCFNLLLTATNTVTAEHKFFCVFMVYIIMYWVLYYYLYFILVLNRLWYMY